MAVQYFDCDLVHVCKFICIILYVFIIDESLCIFIYGVIIFMVHCNNTVVSKIVTVIRANVITMILI